VFAPNVPDASRNEQSMFVRIEFADGPACLATGDAGPSGIGAWLDSPLGAPTDVVVLPHHGRGSASAARALLARTAPRLALVSNAEPDGATALGALARSLGIAVLHTGRNGDLRVSVRDGLAVHAEWPLLPRAP
jgi:beta-lactamase superfamily II metal-dependent hydrolase